MHQKLMLLRLKKSYEEGRKVTQREVANAVGVSVQHYSSVERGQYKAGFELLYKLAKFYGVDVEELKVNHES